MSKPRIILLDLETTPNLVTTWGLKIDGFIPPCNLVKERHILSAAWKHLGIDKVKSIHFQSKKLPAGAEPDYWICAALLDVLNHADGVIAHNGDNFDMKWIMARLIRNGFPPPKPVIQVDTLKIARSKFLFNSNKLDYLGDFLGVGRKIETNFQLWRDCMFGTGKVQRAAIKTMVAYNEEDVNLLERVFEKLRPFVPSKINCALFVEDAGPDSRICPTCGRDTLHFEGFSYTRAQRRRNMVCGLRDQKTRKLKPGSGCGAWSYRPVALIERPEKGFAR